MSKTHPLILVSLSATLGAVFLLTGAVYIAMPRYTLPTLLIAFPYLVLGGMGYGLFRKRERIRNMGRGVFILGGYVTLGAAFAVIDTDPGLPDVVPAMLGIIYSMVFLWRKARVQPVLMLGGVGLGVLCGIGWATVGMLGLDVEAALAVVQAISIALISVVFIKAAQFDMRLASAVSSGSVLAGAMFALVPVTGAGSPAIIPAAVLMLAAFTAAAVARQSVAFGFLVGVGAMPLVFVENMEIVFGLPLPYWPIGFGLAIAFCGVAWSAALAYEQPLPRVGLVSLAALAVVTLPVAYFLTGGRWFQPHTYLVVMADQPDTSAARAIADYDDRRQTVYEELTAFAEADQAAVRALMGRAPHTPYYIVNAVEVQGGGPLLRLRLTLHADVDRILTSPRPRPRRPVEPAPTGQASPYEGPLPWGVRAINAPEVWEAYGVRGEGIVVGIADSGTDWQHPALAPTYAGSADDHSFAWFDPWYATTQPTDTDGHGTHTAGTVVGQGIGVAPAATWIACRNLGENLGNPAYYMGCMQFLFAPHPMAGDPFTEGDPARGAHIVNNSWGCPPEEGCDNQTLVQAVTHLSDAGQMMVISAGNEGPRCGTVYSASTALPAVVVGATGQTDEVTFFSSRGEGDAIPIVDIVAPGSGVLSAVPGGYSSFDGTSMAGPHVAGAVALLWSAQPALIGEIEATEALLRETAQPIIMEDNACGTGEGWSQAAGFGLIDVAAAVATVRD